MYQSSKVRDGIKKRQDRHHESHRRLDSTRKWYMEDRLNTRELCVPLVKKEERAAGGSKEKGRKEDRKKKKVYLIWWRRRVVLQTPWDPDDGIPLFFLLFSIYSSLSLLFQQQLSLTHSSREITGSLFFLQNNLSLGLFVSSLSLSFSCPSIFSMTAQV